MRYAAKTEVSSERSRAEIVRILHRYGCDQLGYGFQDGQAMIMFALAGRHVRLLIPLPKKAEFTKTPQGRPRRSKQRIDAAYEQSIRQRWRALALVLKAKLEAVEAGIASFDQEFLPYIMLPDGKAVEQHILPEVVEACESGRMPKALLPMFTGSD